MPSSENTGYLVQLKSPEGENVYPIISAEMIKDKNGNTFNLLELKEQVDSLLQIGFVATVPTQSGSLTYNGSVQNPTWFGYDTASTTISGQTSGTNAGTYTATFTLNEGYRWPDGTTTAKNVEWTIGKATPTLTLSPNSVTVDGTSAATSTITYTGDGTLSVQSSNSSVATASLSGTTITVNGVKRGDIYVTVSASEGTNYAAASADLEVESNVPTVFSEASWSDIQAAVLTGSYKTNFNIGDTKDVELTGIGTMTLQIADFDHDYLSGSTSASKAGITLITKNLLPDTKQINSTNTNVGGFPASDLYDYLNEDIYNALPEDLKSIIVPIYKWYGTGNNTQNGEWHGCKVWAPLEYEMFGSTTHSPATEHTTGNARKYPIFTDNNSRIKKLNNGSGQANVYWEASPNASNSSQFCGVNIGGTASGYLNVGDPRGICFGICIGNGVQASSFATDSWDTIAAVAEAGAADQVYNLGDTKDIEISGVGTMTLEIADFNHDYLSGSTSADKADISLITKDLLPSTRQMNQMMSNDDGFPASGLYDYLNTTILNGLPTDLNNHVKTIYKWYGTGGSTTDGEWHGCKVWIPLEYEFFGDETYAPTTERTTGNARKYPIFTDNASRIKKLNNGSGQANCYWEASPAAVSSTGFCITHSSGAPDDYYNATSLSGVCFGLCI